LLDAYQVYEARAIGADCILLIVAALDDGQMQDLYDLSKSLGMDVLIEVHDKRELERALELSPEMIGVNNRNLKTLEVNIQTSHDLANMIPEDCLRVAESGIGTHAEIQKLQSSGYNTFLVGESLMRQNDVTQATRALLGTE
jgi:indole-3-glycerol phosphate synthase